MFLSRDAFGLGVLLAVLMPAVAVLHAADCDDNGQDDAAELANTRAGFSFSQQFW